MENFDDVTLSCSHPARTSPENAYYNLPWSYCCSMTRHVGSLRASQLPRRVKYEYVVELKHTKKFNPFHGHN
jgi:hypothetical protein